MPNGRYDVYYQDTKIEHLSFAIGEVSDGDDGGDNGTGDDLSGLTFTLLDHSIKTTKGIQVSGNSTQLELTLRGDGHAYEKAQTTSRGITWFAGLPNGRYDVFYQDTKIEQLSFVIGEVSDGDNGTGDDLSGLTFTLLNSSVQTTKGVQVTGTSSLDITVRSDTYEDTRAISRGIVWFTSLPNGTYTVHVGNTNIEHITFTIGDPQQGSDGGGDGELPDLSNAAYELLNSNVKTTKGIRLLTISENVSIRLTNEDGYDSTQVTSRSIAWFHNIVNGSYRIYVNGILLGDPLLINNSEQTETPPPEVPSNLSFEILNSHTTTTKGVRVYGSDKNVDITIENDNGFSKTVTTTRMIAWFSSLKSGVYRVLFGGQQVETFEVTSDMSAEKDPIVHKPSYDITILDSSVTTTKGIRLTHNNQVRLKEISFNEQGELIDGYDRTANTSRNVVWFTELRQDKLYAIFIDGDIHGFIALSPIVYEYQGENIFFNQSKAAFTKLETEEIIIIRENDIEYLIPVNE